MLLWTTLFIFPPTSLIFLELASISISMLIFSCMVHACFCSRVDLVYCNSPFAGSPQSRMAPHQLVLKIAAARLIALHSSVLPYIYFFGRTTPLASSFCTDSVWNFLLHLKSVLGLAPPSHCKLSLQSLIDHFAFYRP